LTTILQDSVHTYIGWGG